MDITIYLPDKIGQWAKDASINLSQTLRSELERECAQRATIAATLETSTEYTLYDEDSDVDYVLHGSLIAEDQRGDVAIYLAEDGSVYAYDARKQRLKTFSRSETIADWLRGWLDDHATYAKAMRALGESPAVHIGQGTSP